LNEQLFIQNSMFKIQHKHYDKNYLTIAFRNLFRRKGYSALNIAGLAIGITCCLLIFQYVSYEKSYDRFSNEAPGIVRLRLDSYQEGKLRWKSATSYPAIGPTLKKELPEVQDFCRLIDNEALLSNDERNVHFNEKKGYFADPSSIDMLGVKLLKGNPVKALDAPDKMVISETMAKNILVQKMRSGKDWLPKVIQSPIIRDHRCF
jgi:putative ABC transport system permease protein